MEKWFCAALVLLTLTLIRNCAGENDVIVKNLKLYVNCEEYFIKAICYSPTPIGRWTKESQNEGGLCSKRMNAKGIEESACEDEDMFDGSPADPARVPPGPSTGWFNSLWERDFPVIKELGANTIRIYHTSGYTRQASIEQLGKNEIVHPLGKEHISFMNLASSFGFKVIFPLPGEEIYLRGYTEDQVKQLIRNIVDEVGNHSALLMWTMGNELPLLGGASLLNEVNKYSHYARLYTKQKWNRFVPVTHAVVDLPLSYDFLAANMYVDVFSSNAGYRGLDFSDLWRGSPGQNFSGWANLSRIYNKPLFISEVGWHTVNSQINYDVPTWFNQKYRDLLKHLDQGVIGMAFFEYSDEGNKADVAQQTMGLVQYVPTAGKEGSSTLPNVFIADGLQRKPIIFDAVKQGILDGKQYNYNGDVWTLVGRSADKLNLADCVAPELNTNPPPMITTGYVPIPTTEATTQPITGTQPHVSHTYDTQMHSTSGTGSTIGFTETTVTNTTSDTSASTTETPAPSISKNEITNSASSTAIGLLTLIVLAWFLFW